MTSTIALPPDFQSNIASQATGLISSFQGFIILIVGVLLVAVVIEIVVGAFRK